ncbi:MAG: hypothetical protein ACT4O2_14190 [Beijerinckiaceae bacterium]
MATDLKLSASPEAARVRLTLDLSQKLNAIVDKIAAENDTSKADVLRFAIEFLGAATNAKRDGMQVGAWKESDDGTRREREFVGL